MKRRQEGGGEAEKNGQKVSEDTWMDGGLTFGPFAG